MQDRGGAIYVFDVTTGEQLRKLIPEVEYPRRGLTIEIDGSQVIIGATGNHDACPEIGCWSGGAFVFDLETGEAFQTMTLEDGQHSDYLGADSSLDGSVAILGGMNSATNAHFFDTTTGNELLRIPGGYAFAGADGKAVVVTLDRTMLMDIRSVPEPSAIYILSAGGLVLFGLRRHSMAFANPFLCANVD